MANGNSNGAVVLSLVSFIIGYLAQPVSKIIQKLMGQIQYSCKSKRSTEVVCPQAQGEGVRVVHINGQIDVFPTPVNVKWLLQNHPHHFVCCSRGLYAIRTNRPPVAMKELRKGGIYFILPFSLLDSHDNLALVIARLLATAKKKPSNPAEGRTTAIDLETSKQLMGRCPNTEMQMVYKNHMLCKSRSWSPGLDTIKEAACLPN